MAVTPLEHLHPDAARAGLLERAVGLRDLAAQAERELLMTVAEWAETHTTGALMPDPFVAYGAISDAWVDRFGMDGADRMLDLAGPGAPEVSDFAVTELAAALGRTTESGRLLVGDALEAKHRLPGIWARLEAGQLEVWRVRRITRLTRSISAEAVAFVDAHLAHVAHTAGLPTVDRLVQEAAARFDPEACEVEECDRRNGLHVGINLAEVATSVGKASAVSVGALLDRADAEELEAAIRALADQLLQTQTTTGSSIDTLDIRRAKALGMLARGEFFSPSQRAGEAGRAPVRRQVVLHIHLSQAALSGAPEVDPTSDTLGVHLARLDNHRQLVTADAVRDWCAVPGSQVVVKPVMDLGESVSVDAYEIPDRIAARVRLTRPTCVFPFCSRPAHTTDLDHVQEFVPPDEGGPPGQTSTDNLAPLCRKHHRAKTHPSPVPGPHATRWRYQRACAGTWIWTSPRDRTYLVHPDGTTPLRSQTVRGASAS